ncbi:Membrane transport protein [Corynebacterium ciconiae DSM 44920]|uniref:AEC family transporter n=1 Tax=Corynebacterium ciconiae TaxID=227319 RepID=UPI00037FB8BA|nr:AEC family transporter [Corynebacterium ciconiae]WKD61079.1 Membrane transport protein [Corynebacterium ciconiae DSM 44920]
MGGIVTSYGIILGLIAVGFIMGTTKVIASDEQRTVLDRLAFYAALPALLFTVVARSEPEHMLSPVLIVTSVAAVITALVFVAIARAYGTCNRADLTIGAASSSYMNSNNIGLPVSMYVLGNAAYAAPVVLFQVLIYAPIILALIDRSSSLVVSVRHAVLSPLVLGSAAGLIVAFSHVDVPEAVFHPLEVLGGAAIPLMLMSFGASLTTATPLRDPHARTLTFWAVGLKQVGMPLAALACGLLLGLSQQQLFAAMILAALPTAQNVYNYASNYGRDTRIPRDTGLITTFTALPTMMVIAAFLG